MVRTPELFLGCLAAIPAVLHVQDVLLIAVPVDVALDVPDHVLYRLLQLLFDLGDQVGVVLAGGLRLAEHHVSRHDHELPFHEG